MGVKSCYASLGGQEKKKREREEGTDDSVRKPFTIKTVKEKTGTLIS